MKISLAWIFDHLQASWHDFAVQEIVSRFTRSIVPIEHCKKVSWHPEKVILACVVHVRDAGTVVLESMEYRHEIVVAGRPDVRVGGWYMVATSAQGWMWATAQDFGGTTSTLLPELVCAETELDGSWKKNSIFEDYIFDIDNISITHRPDLWGHRGIARELGALYDIPLVPYNDILFPLQQEHHERSTNAPGTYRCGDRAIQVHVAPSECASLGLVAATVIPQPSALWMLRRLVSIDAKPLNSLVDATNYTMFDMGHPLHAFDAQTWTSSTFSVSHAPAGKKLVLLDGKEITLSSADIVIQDGTHPASLAGIMGGKSTAVSDTTTQIYLEAACWNPVTIRARAAEHKLRTEASTRFEKSLDPWTVGPVLLRCLKLLDELDILQDCTTKLLLIEPPDAPSYIDLEHSFVEARLGIVLPRSFVVDTLHALGCSVEEHKNVYRICIPSWRRQDLRQPVDLVEELGRFWGYEKITPLLPALTILPSSHIAAYEQMQQIRSLCAYGMRAHEVKNYAVFDPNILSWLAWEPHDVLHILNPLSERANIMVTTLLVNLVQTLLNNLPSAEPLRFFEINNVWTKEMQRVRERTMVAGLAYAPQDEQGLFFEQKDVLSQLFTAVGCPVMWKKVEKVSYPWLHPYQTAVLLCHDVVVGVQGILHPTYAHKLRGVVSMYEFDLNLLVSYQQKNVQYKPLPKYPGSWRDISVLAPCTISVEELLDTISHASDQVVRAQLHDIFTQPEWETYRSVTVRFLVQHEQKTMTTHEIDDVYSQVEQALIHKGATVR